MVVLLCVQRMSDRQRYGLSTDLLVNLDFYIYREIREAKVNATTGVEDQKQVCFNCKQKKRQISDNVVRLIMSIAGW